MQKIYEWPHTTSRSFFQAKLDSEINARCVLNEDGELHFLLENVPTDGFKTYHEVR